MDARYAAIGLTLVLGATHSLAAAPQRWRRPADPPAIAAREQTLRRAQVWSEPAVPIASARLGANPTGSEAFSENAVVPCRFKPGGVGGTTPKFDCEIEGSEKLRVKYGRDNPEVFAEVMASRLLSALGFPTDQLYVLEGVRCFGCPEDPFASLQCLNDGSSLDQCFSSIDFSRARDFETVVVERQLRGRRIETRKDPGWTWEELTKIDPEAGGAPRAHLDALRLMAVFLSHWDNKSANQRLLCVEQAPTKKAKKGGTNECGQPLAMVQDLGGTFGPFKLDLEGWRSTPIWNDPATCRVSMRSLPYGGSTFPDINISEAGRGFLAARLRLLTQTQVRDLFVGARLSRYNHRTDAGRSVDSWVQAFEEKVRAITDHPGCPVA